MSAYLKALRPFLCTNDALKEKKLEWIFGVPALLHGRCYGERPKYGLELVDKIGDDCLQFNSPVLFAATDEALVAQIIKCKGRFDQQCIACFTTTLLVGLDQNDNRSATIYIVKFRCCEVTCDIRAVAETKP